MTKFTLRQILTFPTDAKYIFFKVDFQMSMVESERRRKQRCNNRKRSGGGKPKSLDAQQPLSRKQSFRKEEASLKPIFFFSFFFLLYRQDLYLNPILTPNTLSMPIISTRKSQFLNLVKEIDA